MTVRQDGIVPGAPGGRHGDSPHSRTPAVAVPEQQATPLLVQDQVPLILMARR